MKVKYSLLTIVLTVSILFFGTTATAQISEADLQAMIAQLQAQISLLLQQVAQLQAEQGTTQTWCYTFNNNLGYKSSGNTDVGFLHSALEKEGISYAPDIGNTYSNGTASAVVQFQEKYASETLTLWGLKHGTGYMGTTTRAKLNKLYKCDDSTSTQTSVADPTPTTDKGHPTIPNPLPPQEPLPSLQKPFISSINPLSGGKDTVVTLNGSNFILKSPVIFNQDGVIRAVINNVYVSSSQLKITLDNLLIEKLDQGTYQLRTSNLDGFSNSINFTFFPYVWPKPYVFQPEQSIEIISQNDERTYYIGRDELNIRWKSRGVKQVYIFLVAYDNQGNQTSITEIVSGLDADPFDYYLYKIPLGMDSNKLYKVIVSSTKNLSNGVLDYSDNYFFLKYPTIDPYGKDSPPAIVVKYPVGGETITVGQNVTIKWNGYGMWGGKVFIQLENDSYKYKIAEDISGSLGVYYWTVKSLDNFNLSNNSKFKIRIGGYSADNIYVEDTSDNYFNIIPEVISCIDTDGGIDYNIKGTTISGVENNKSLTDYCDSGQLIEAYCGTDGKILTKSYQCPYGCSAGFCMGAPEAFLYLLYPTGGEELERGQTLPILWTSGLVEKINIVITGDSDSTVIDSNIPALQSYYDWVIPSTINKGSYTMTIYDVNNASSVVATSSKFNIVDAQLP